MVPELNSTRSDFFNCVSPDGLTAVVSSERTDMGQGGSDLYMATRLTATSPWSTPDPLTSLNTNHNDGSAWVSADACWIYFSSNRDGSAGIFRATRASATDPWNPPVPVIELNSSEDESDPWLNDAMDTILFVRGVYPTRAIYQAKRP